VLLLAFSVIAHFACLAELHAVWTYFLDVAVFIILFDFITNVTGIPTGFSAVATHLFLAGVARSVLIVSFVYLFLAYSARPVIVVIP